MKKVFASIDYVSKDCGKSKVWVFFDMVSCFLLHGAGHNDYRKFKLYQCNNKQRATYVTRVRNKKLITLLNDEEYSNFFDSKLIFNERFKKYLGRDYMAIETATFEDFCKFMEGKDDVFAKPDGLSSGKGIERLYKKDFASLEDMWAYINSDDKLFDLLEESIVQHPALAQIHPASVNSLRVVTLNYNGEVYIPYACLKAGNNNAVVDNVGPGGVTSRVDRETGICSKYLANEYGEVVTKHPLTGFDFEGFKVPYWEEVKKLATEVAKEVPQLGLVGWDIYVGPNGPGIIEGNNYPGYDFDQIPEDFPDKIGTWAFYKSIIKELN